MGLVASLVSCAALAVLTPFRPGEVTVGGEIGRRMDVTVRKMLRHTDVEATFARHFRNRKEKPDEPGGFAGYGMFLDALVKAAAHGVGGAETVAAKTRLLKELGELQTPDGRISMYSGDPGFWDNHEGAYMIQALVLDYRWFGTESSLATARRLADSLLAAKAFPTLGSETAYLLLAEETGDARYRDWLVKEADIRADIATYDGRLKVNGVQHVYTWLARALAQLQFDPQLAAAADEAFARAAGPYLSVTGSITGKPHWGELWDDSETGLGKWGETCASAYLMRLAAKRVESDPSSRYGDLFERILYNAFFSAQSADGLRYRYWTPFDECPPWFDRDTYCCPNNYKREVFEIPDMAFFGMPDGLVVNLYAPAELKCGWAAVRMETAYPDEGAVALKVRMDRRTLRLRIPAWCRGATVRTGADAPVRADPGWFDVTRDFTAETDVRLDLPMPVRLVRGAGAQAGRVAVLRGPCVYALDPATNGVWTQGCDLWELDASRPMDWRPGEKAVAVTAQSRNRGVETRELLLTRYCSEGRERTFFGTVGEARTEDDELKRPAAEKVRVGVDFSRTDGPILPLHGVNNAPMRTSGPQRELAAAAIPFVRTHDTGGAYGGTHYIDIPNLFPDFAADEDDPANYDFALTDAWLGTLVGSGIEPFFRLGVTIEGARRRIRTYNIDPPSDFGKWARIAEHVIRHYTEGWANGRTWRISHWEIWNEPDNPDMWTGTKEQFLEFYRIVSTHLKKRFPDLRIGGYGSCGFKEVWEPECSLAFANGSWLDWYRSFVDYVTAPATACPVDFLSWHIYTDTPEEVAKWARYCRTYMDAHGLKDAEAILDEWNFIVHGRDGDDQFDRMKEKPGAAFVAAVFCLLQRDRTVSKAMYYDAMPTRRYCGLFYFPSGRTTPCYEAFRDFGRLYRLGASVPVSFPGEGVYACAAKGGDGKAVLLVNSRPRPVEVELVVDGKASRRIALDAETVRLVGCED